MACEFIVGIPVLICLAFLRMSPLCCEFIVGIPVLVYLAFLRMRPPML